jgi:DNA-binding SARP family transcriptional activator
VFHLTRKREPLTSTQSSRGQGRPRLVLLNGFELRCRGYPVHLPKHGQRLLAFLALQHRDVLRTYVASILWPDTSEDRASASLRSALWRLRGCGVALVKSHGSTISLEQTVAVDVREMEQVALHVLDATFDGLVEPELLTESGELLPGFYDEWVLVERERLRQLRLHGLEALCDRLIGVQKYAEAVAAGLSAVAVEPLRESAQGVLIKAYLAEGNRAEAIRQLGRYREVLRDELDLEVPPEFLATLGISTNFRLNHSGRRTTRGVPGRWSESSVPT